MGEINQDWIDFCDRNSSPTVDGSLNDKWVNFLTQQNGAFTDFQDSTITFLVNSGATGGTYNDLWRSFLTLQGYDTGDLNADMDSFFLGSTPSLLDELLLEDSTNLLLEDSTNLLLET